MKVFIYRLIDQNPDNDPDNNTGEVGLAVVNNLSGLFWLLDEFTDPYIYEFAPAQVGDALSAPVIFNGDDPDIDPDGIGKVHDLADESHSPITTGFLSGNIRSHKREWKQFIYPHTDKYKTKPAASANEPDIEGASTHKGG